MQAFDEPCPEEPRSHSRPACDSEPAQATSRERIAPGSATPPAQEILQSALYSAARFAESLLRAGGRVDVRMTRILCSPDGRCWTLAFDEHSFLVEILDEGFFVRALGPSLAVLAA